MTVKKNDDIEFSELTQTVEGWKLIIFLPFSFIWQTLITVSIVICYIIITTAVSFKVYEKDILYVIYPCDFMFFVDVLCAFLHYLLGSTRKLKNYPRKPLLSFLVDILSLIPLEYIYKFMHFNMEKDQEETWLMLFLNRIIRIYRLYFHVKRNKVFDHVNLSFYIEFIEFCVIGFLISHTFTCFYRIMSTEEELKDCSEKEYVCITVLETKLLLVALHNFMGDARLYNTMPKKIVLCIFLVITSFYYRGIMLPSLIFRCMNRFRNVFRYRDRYMSLKLFVDNVIESKELKKKTVSEFENIWLNGKGNIEPKLLKKFPMNLRKNVYSDLYWDSIRHSELLRSVSFSCKRAIAKAITGDFYLPGMVLWNLGEEKHYMIYVASGMIQLMAEENSESPILSLSSGTVLGESNIFFSTPSKAIVKVVSFAELHTLSFKNLLRVMRDYPMDKDVVWGKLKDRVAVARMTQYRKNVILKQVSMAKNEYAFDHQAEDDCIKWIKNQFRLIVSLNERFSKHADEYGTPYLTQSSLKASLDTKPQIGHTSIYLPMLNMSDGVLVRTDLMCLKTTIPWVIDPGCHFIKMWNFLIIFCAVFSSLAYPVFIGWWETLPFWIFNLSGMITLLYIIDVIVKISTAVKTKDILLIKSGAIFRYRIRSLSFYADIIAAAPMQIILTCANASSKTITCSIGFSLFKIYKTKIFFNEWCETMKPMIGIRVMIKYIFFFNLLVYWASALFNLIEVQCLYNFCSLKTWYDPSLEDEYPGYKSLIAVFFSIKLLANIPGKLNFLSDHPFSALELGTLFLAQLLFMTWMGEYNAAHMLDVSNSLKYKRIVNSVYEFMRRQGIVGRIKKRVMDTLTFHWYYDYGDVLMEENEIQEETPPHLKKEIDRDTLFKALRTCQLFEFEDDDLIWALCKKCMRLSLPANSIVCTYGTQTMQIYIVYKGFLQLNSFLPRDTILGYATPILYDRGRVVPLIVALNQLPSAVTGRTITDCELIVFNVEDFLTTLIIHDCFKDYFEVIKKIDITGIKNSKLTLSLVGNAFTVEDKPYKAAFAKLKFFGLILRLFLMRRSIHCESSYLVIWEFFRVICYITENILWPIFLVLFLQTDRYFLLYVLLALDSLWVADFYIKLHVGFYNKKGIYVSHTLITARHYLTSSFLFDLVLLAPFLHSIYILAEDSSFPVNNTVIYVHIFIRLLSLYRILRFISYCERIFNFIVLLKSIKFIIILIIILNTASVLKVHTETVWWFDSDSSLRFTLSPDGWVKAVDIKDVTHPIHLYVIIIYCFTMIVTRRQTMLQRFTTSSLIVKSVFSALGLVLHIVIYSMFAVRMASSNKKFAAYKYHVGSLMSFLRSGESEDKISQMVIKHFDHVWEYKKDEDLKKLFSHFPNILQEDLTFPIYQKTLSGVPCFREANQAFFRILSRCFTEEYYIKGSKLIFKNGVSNMIYLIHSGECLVVDKEVILNKGSMIGDLKGKGKMTNDIITLNHAVMLTISSPNFFSILNNFYSTEKAFFDLINSVDDYIKSIYMLKKKMKTNEEMAQSEKFDESKFEPSDDVSSNRGNGMTKGSKRSYIVHPQSVYARAIGIIAVSDAFLVSLLIPIIICLRFRAVAAHAIIYVLDAIWIVKIIMSFNTAYVEPNTGSIVSDKRKIAKNYAKQFNGFIMDVLSVVPFELLSLLIKTWNKNWPDYIYDCSFLLRLLRIVSVWIKIHKESQRMGLSESVRVIRVFLRHIFILNVFSALNLVVAAGRHEILDRNHYIFDEPLGKTLVRNYLEVLNVFFGVGIPGSSPKTILEILYHIAVSLASVVELNLLSTDMLLVLNILFHIKSEQESEIEFLKRFLTVRDASPAMKKAALYYARSILQSYKGEVMPKFLRHSPYYLKVEIMQDLYMHHLLHCNAFSNLSTDILKQLSARLRRYIYFPKDVITKQGDVDHTMYFIHKGEVLQIENDKRYPGLSYARNEYNANDYFGEKQGLIYGVPQEHTFIAKTVADILSLNYLDWADIRSAFPEETKSVIPTDISPTVRYDLIPTGSDFQILM